MGFRQPLSDLDDDEKRLIGPFIPVQYRLPSNQEYRGFCAICEDPAKSKTPSASYNFILGQWHCMKNDCGGTITKLMRTLKAREKRANEKSADVVDLDSRRKKPSKPLPTERQIKGFVAQLQAQPTLLEKVLVEKRGLDPDSIERFKVGWDRSNGKGRFTLPVYARDGKTLLNVRMYDHRARGTAPKMLPFAVGYGTQLFNAVALEKADDIVLCEGEWDCIINEQHGVPTVTHTGGAGSFQMSWAKEFKGKHVFICFDEDEGGIKGATRTARMLRDVAAGVYIIGNLGTGKKSGDITDFYMQGGTADQFRSLMEEARLKPFARDESEHIVPLKGKHVDLEETQNAAHNDPLEVSVRIAGKVTPPYLAPKRIHGVCDQNKGKICATCPMAAYNGDRWLDTSPDDPSLLKFVSVSETQKYVVLRGLFGAACADRIEYTVADEWTIEELVVSQDVEEVSGRVANPMSRKVFNVGSYKTPINTKALMVGNQVADPRDSRGIFHSWHTEQVASNIDDFHLSDRDKVLLRKRFRPAKGQSPLDKAKEIAAKHEYVTQIYGRGQLHVAYDLIWHSVQSFVFNGKPITKGWLEGIVIGDTRTGKSETAMMLAKHYNAGVIKSCEGTTFAGLVGGAQAMPQGKGWMITWGIIPMNDRRLVVLDEVSGMAERDIIEQMSSIRSSGVAQITKIASDETSARTRLIWISNPADGKRIAEMPAGGTEGLKRLVKNPEDIARFDFALTASNADVSTETVVADHHLRKHGDEACRKLLTWAWSRREDQVKFTALAEKATITAAIDLGHRYLPDPPLVQGENIRMKIARIAAAIAARTFSCDDACEVVIVKKAHVEAAVEFLDWVYGVDTMGYLRMSNLIRRDREDAQKNKPRVIKFLKDNPSLIEALRAVMYADSFRPRDFEEFGGGDIDPNQAVKELLKMKMLRRLTKEGQGGRISLEPAMIEVLKVLEDRDV